MLHDIQPISRSHGERKQQLQTTRERIIQVGLRKVLEGGWAATGIDAVLRECSIPKGSFYHYFDNKEAFGYALMDSYQAFFMARLAKWFVNAPTDSLSSLQAAMDGFVADAGEGMERYGYQRGCLIGALGQEVASLHQGFRARLQGHLQQWEAVVADALLQCAGSYLQGSKPQAKNFKTTGLLSAERSADLQAQCRSFAQEFWAMWEGAVLHSLLSQRSDMLHAIVRRFMAQWTFWLTGLPSASRQARQSAGAVAIATPSSKPVKSPKPSKPALRSEPSQPSLLAAQKSTPMRKKSIKIKDVQSNLDF